MSYLPPYVSPQRNVSTINLLPGDVTRRGTISHVERRMDILSACIVYFTDGSFFHAGIYDAWTIASR